MRYSEEFIREVTARMIAKAPIFPEDMPLSLRRQIRECIDRKTPEEIRAAGAKAWREVMHGEA